MLHVSPVPTAPAVKVPEIVPGVPTATVEPVLEDRALTVPPLLP